MGAQCPSSLTAKAQRQCGQVSALPQPLHGFLLLSSVAAHPGPYKVPNPRLSWKSGLLSSVNENVCVTSGTGDFQGCDCRLQPGGVGPAGRSSKGSDREVRLENYQNLLALGKMAPPKLGVCCQLSSHAGSVLAVQGQPCQKEQ